MARGHLFILLTHPVQPEPTLKAQTRSIFGYLFQSTLDMYK